MQEMTGSFIYKVLRPEEWALLDVDNFSTGSPVDIKDGFIHFSTAAQLRETVDKHFKQADDLILAQLIHTQLGAGVKWELSRGGQLFAHLYGPLRRADVTAYWRLSRDSQGRYAYPEEIFD